MQMELIASEQQVLKTIFDQQRHYALTLRKTNAAFRLQKLAAFQQAIEESEAELIAALWADFKKPEIEVKLTELAPLYLEFKHIKKELKTWMRPKRVSNSFPFLLGKSEIRLEPKGVCLIIAPWNYPFNLAISPLIAAIAAGNAVTIKPSEFTPHTSAFISKLISRVFKPEEVNVVEGGVETAQALLDLPFQHIFFTGSTAVGKEVMRAAAQHLSGLTLELGGKSPAVVDESADLTDTARKLVWGKLLNAGQTCIAPDYVLINDGMIQPLVEKIKVALAEMRQNDTDLASIVSQKHFERMQNLLKDAKAKGARVEIEGLVDEANLRFGPVVLSDVTDEMLLMQEEIFGPLLPIIGFKHSNEAISYINAHDKPLALYIFSQNDYKTNQLLQETSAGGSCVNDVVVHITNPNLPFGGINQSGMGHYHGYAGFKSFSHERSVFHQFTGFGLNVNRLLYPPYDKKKERLIKWLMKLIK